MSRSVSSERSSSNRFFSTSVIGIRLPASAASYTQKFIVRSCIYNSTWAQWISGTFIKEECRKIWIISALIVLFNLFRSKTLSANRLIVSVFHHKRAGPLETCPGLQSTRCTLKCPVSLRQKSATSNSSWLVELFFLFLQKDECKVQTN